MVISTFYFYWLFKFDLSVVLLGPIVISCSVNSFISFSVNFFTLALTYWLLNVSVGNPEYLILLFSSFSSNEDPLISLFYSPQIGGKTGPIRIYQESEIQI